MFNRKYLWPKFADMSLQDRVPKELFKEDGHYLGRPADADDKIIHRRVKLTRDVPGFLNKDKSLLEIGCGNGATMFLLSEEFKQLDGIEVNEDHLQEFENVAKSNGINNCAYSIVDVVKSSPTKQYDRLISFEVIEHLESHDGLKYYYDSLKPDGIMVVSVPNKWWIFETHGAKLPLLPWNRVPFFSWLPNFIHGRYANARIYRKREIVALLEDYGFKVLNTKYITAPMDVLPKGKFKDWVVRNFFNTDVTPLAIKSPSIFVVATKKAE